MRKPVKQVSMIEISLRGRGRWGSMYSLEKVVRLQLLSGIEWEAPSMKINLIGKCIRDIIIMSDCLR